MYVFWPNEIGGEMNTIGIEEACLICMGAMGGAPRHVPPLEDFWGGAPHPPRLPRKRKKSIKSGLKTRLERFKNQKFSYPGEGDTPSPGPHPPRRGPTGLGAYTRPFGPRWCPPWKISRCATAPRGCSLRKCFLFRLGF